MGRCQNGVPLACVPGTPAAETCNDADDFSIAATETDRTCACAFPFTDEDYQIRVTLSVPVTRRLLRRGRGRF